MAEPGDPRRLPRYSGRVTAIIVLVIVVVFVLLNVISNRLVPEPHQPVQPPIVTERPAV